MSDARRRNRSDRLVMLLLGASLLAGCNDQIVYRDKPIITPPPAAAGDFLGYSNDLQKQTVCGNCHSGKQAAWQQTAHASAWGDLLASGHAEGSCEACHAVSAKGNAVASENVGWTSTRDSHYQDVQCESCHGPGLKHVLNPDVAPNQPLASIAVDTLLTYGCAECHSGPRQPFMEEWKASGHGNLREFRNTNPSCVGCHDAKGALAAWGVKTNFVEASSATAYMTVTCAVCHDPHDKTNERQLRLSISATDTSRNLCMRCHQRRAKPDQSSTAGPHSPQGPLLLGMAGWFPPNFPYQPGQLRASHGSDRNPKLCVSCHMNDYELTDATGKFAFRSTGHSFDPIPCVDAQGIPTGASDCELSERSFKTCVQCHLSEDAARSAFSVADLRITTLADQITAMLAQVPSTETRTGDNLITTAEGAKFNRDMAKMAGSKIHNPFLMEALLLATIQQLRTDYQLQPSAQLSLVPVFKP